MMVNISNVRGGAPLGTFQRYRGDFWNKDKGKKGLVKEKKDFSSRYS